MARILIAEDENVISSLLEYNLALDGYKVTVARDGASALQKWQASSPDLVVLDVMMPHKDGYTVCREARAAGLSAPVLFLSAKGEPHERVMGLAAGGDDYLVKPFHLPEFLLRVANLLRRTPPPAMLKPTYSFAGITIDFAAYTVQTPQGLEQLGERELRLLQLLVEQRNKVVSRNQMLDAVWGKEHFPSSRTVDNFVVRLRRILEDDPGNPRFLHTIWGVGYKFTPLE